MFGALTRRSCRRSGLVRTAEIGGRNTILIDKKVLSRMLDWFVDRLMAIITYVPALIVTQDSPHFYVVRGMFGLLLIVLAILAVALRAEILSCMSRFWKS